MFFVFNLPLLAIYSQAKRYSIGEMTTEKRETVYKWNSRFLYLYFLRWIFIIVGGFIFLIFITNHDRSVKFICDRFTTLDYGQAKDEQWNQCMHSFRIWAYLIYPAVVGFQLHCIRTIINYRNLYENK